MHGLIFRTVQVFLQDTYGARTWQDVVRAAALDLTEFEAMLHYDDWLLDEVLEGAASVLGKSRAAILEDVGTYLISHPNREGLRRLLRFGGEDFTEFLYSLNDLPDRARLAVSDLDLPDLELRDFGNGRFCLQVAGPYEGFSWVLMGVLRAMADDYGTLAMLDHHGMARARAMIDVVIVQQEYARGRNFELGAMPYDQSAAS